MFLKAFSSSWQLTHFFHAEKKRKKTFHAEKKRKKISLMLRKRGKILFRAQERDQKIHCANSYCLIFMWNLIIFHQICQFYLWNSTIFGLKFSFRDSEILRQLSRNLGNNRPIFVSMINRRNSQNVQIVVSQFARCPEWKKQWSPFWFWPWFSPFGARLWYFLPQSFSCSSNSTWWNLHRSFFPRCQLQSPFWDALTC